MSNICVYQHIRLDTNEVFYIGIGNIKRPYIISNRNIHWKNIVNKVGYKIEILYENLTWEEACNIEINLIKHYGRLDLGTGILINFTNGGEGAKGIVQSKEHLLKRSNALKGRKLFEEHKRRLSEAKKGKTLTDEHKENIRLSRIGKKRIKKI